MLINVATDPDFNLEGEVKGTINSSASAKANFMVNNNIYKSIYFPTTYYISYT